MPLTAGNLTPTIIRDLPGTFILPAPNRLGSKRFSQSIASLNRSGLANALDLAVENLARTGTIETFHRQRQRK